MQLVNKDQKVIYFDGHCGLCNGFVDFVMKHDHQGKFMFSPLQSEYAKTHLPEEYTTDLKSVIVQIEGHTFKKSKAVFKVLKEMNGTWSMLAHLDFLPDPILNFGYDFIALNRYKMFGKRETCRLPTPSERKRFIL